MGNNPSSATYEKYSKYYDSLNSSNGASTNSPHSPHSQQSSTLPAATTLPDIDPYEIFGLSKNFEWEELKAAYKRVAKLVHPDKGGSEVLFNKVSAAFKTLALEYKSRQGNRQYGDLKNSYNDYAKSNPAQPSTIAGNKNDVNFLDRFNRAFEENRFEEDEYGNNVGYANMMAQSSKVREDIKINKAFNKFNSDAFNRKFDETVINTGAATKQVTKYSEPQALPLAKTIQYTELGGDRPADFSSTNEGLGERKNLQYTDYMVAHTTSRLVDPATMKVRKEYKSVSEYEKSRDRMIKKPQTEEELRYLARQKELENMKEEERLRKLKDRDYKIGEHFDRVNRILLK